METKPNPKHLPGPEVDLTKPAPAGLTRIRNTGGRIVIPVKSGDETQMFSYGHGRILDVTPAQLKGIGSYQIVKDEPSAKASDAKADETSEPLNPATSEPSKE